MARLTIGRLNQKIPRIRQGGEVRQQYGPTINVGQVKGDPVICGGHSQYVNTLDIESRQINSVGPAAEIRHRVRAVPGAEHEHVITMAAGQPVVPRPADEGIIALPAEQPVIARPAVHVIVTAARATVQGVVALSAIQNVVAAVAGQDIVVGGAGESLHVRQGVGLRYTVLIGIGDDNSLKPLLNRTIRLHSEHMDGCYQDPEFSIISLLEYTLVVPPCPPAGNAGWPGA